MDDKRLRRAGCTSMSQSNQEETELRRGPWTVDEDFTLMNYIASHGEGRWNTLSRCAGLKRNGKSCRLRWLNYLRPDVRRGNISLEEQLLIIELHSRWGNRWSKIAQHLPGRTDNEIKNYWRTRVQKHAKQLKCDVNSKQFKDTMRCLWMPRLVERIQAAAAASATDAGPATATHDHNLFNNESINLNMIDHSIMNPVDNNNLEFQTGSHMVFPGPVLGNGTAHDLTSSETSAHVTTSSYNLENSSTAGSSESFGNHVSPVSDFPDHHNHHYNYYNTIPIHDSTINHPADTDFFHPAGHDFMGSSFNQGPDQFQTMNDNYLFDGGDASASLWDVDDIFLLQQQFNNTSV